MIPGRAVVASPGRGITLPAGEARPRHHEGALVGAKRAQPVIGRARIFHAIDVVDFGVGRDARGEIIAGDTVAHVERHGLGRRFEDRRLIHVIPDAGNAHRRHRREHAAPPTAGFGPREIGKDRGAGPDRRDIGRAVRIGEEMVARDPAVISGIALVRRMGDMKVDDRDGRDPVGAQITHHLLEMREGAPVDREGAVAILIVDVEPDDVGWDAFRPEPCGERTHLRLGRVGPARLLIAQHPARRQRRPAGECDITTHYIRDRGAGDQIIIDRPVAGTKGRDIGVAMPEIEPAAPAVVEEDAIGAARAAAADKEGDRFVDGVAARLEAPRVGVPVDEALPAPVE